MWDRLRIILFLLLVMNVDALPAQDHGSRDDVTFILGQDKEGDNPFYLLAENYYRYNENDRTEEVITTIGSLSEVQSFLINNAPRNGLPWGNINLVTHGNPYLGLSAKIHPGGLRASAETIWAALDDCTLREMPNNLFDDTTIIEIHGCGLGHNEELVEALKAVFSSECYTPKVEVSKFFECYVNDPNSRKVDQLQADFWTINYKFGYRSTDRSICNKFKAKYPDAPVDWKAALAKESADEVGEEFYYTYDVPVKWVLPFPTKEKVPNLITKSDRLKWVKQQPEFLEYLTKLHIPPENFNWWMRKVTIDYEDGSTSPALWIKGHSTFFCVLRIRKV